MCSVPSRRTSGMDHRGNSFRLSVAFTVGFCASLMFNFSLSTARRASVGSEKNKFRDTSRANTTFGHIHIAKTGGTSLNGILALNFERVCGHKGYSYDYYQANKKFKEAAKSNSPWKSVQDFTSVQPGYNRGRVHSAIMEEIGYEDCDWISIEGNARRWHRFDSWFQRMELHLPCREPIDHLMSQCNFREKNFDCDAYDLGKNVDECLVDPSRFLSELVSDVLYPNIEVKCYDFSVQFTKYFDYMKTLLDQKRIRAEYHPRPTNKQRNKSLECIWNRPLVHDAVSSFLVENYDYYSYCQTCLGSKQDLFLH